MCEGGEGDLVDLFCWKWEVYDCTSVSGVRVESVSVPCVYKGDIQLYGCIPRRFLFEWVCTGRFPAEWVCTGRFPTEWVCTGRFPTEWVCTGRFPTEWVCTREVSSRVGV